MTLFAVVCVAFTALLIILKDRGTIGWHWFFVLMPLWTYFAVVVALFGYFIVLLSQTGTTFWTTLGL